MKLPLVSSLRGRGFSKWEREGTVTLRNAPSASNVTTPPPAVMVSNGCPKCQQVNVVRYRCSPALLCTHPPGFHVECPKCGGFVHPE